MAKSTLFLLFVTIVWTYKALQYPCVMTIVLCFQRPLPCVHMKRCMYKENRLYLRFLTEKPRRFSILSGLYNVSQCAVVPL